MAGSQKKKPILFIGLVVFLAVTIIGFIVDMAILKTGGKVAIISAGIALLVLAGFSAFDWLTRRNAEKKALAENDPAFMSQFDMPSDQRFLRHSDSRADEPDYGGFENSFEDSFDDGFDAYGDDGLDDFDAAPKESPTSLLRRRAAELRASRNKGAGVEDDNTFGDAPAYAGQPAADFDVQPQNDAFGGYEQPNDDFDDMDQPPAPPVRRFEQHTQQPEQPVQQFEQPVQQFEQPAQQFEQPAQQFEQPAQQFEQPAQQFEQPVQQQYEQPVPEAVFQPVVSYMPAEQPVVAAPVQAPAAAPVVVPAGQSIESFFESMGDEDILYRDCVLTWAADAIPSMKRLIRYVDSIEDKKQQALVGRDVEYINAMVERIYAFTRLEYVDQLLELKTYNFSTLVKECLKRFSPFFMEKRLGLLWKGLDVDVVTDRRWFVFALTQVIFNCVEFTPDGGKIAISAKRNGDFIDLMIDDSGKGIASDELACAFIAGYMGDDAPSPYIADEDEEDTPEEAGIRTGMGLFITQSVLRKMGGDAFIESNYGKGTRVTLRVPAPEEKK